MIVVIDSTDRARVSIAKARPARAPAGGRPARCRPSAERASRAQGELFRLLEHEHLANAVVLVLANKQDLQARAPGTDARATPAATPKGPARASSAPP